MYTMIRRVAILFDDALEAVSVHGVDENADNTVTGWFGVSTDASGGIIAYFSTERAAYAYRMLLVNELCNPGGFAGDGEA